MRARILFSALIFLALVSFSDRCAAGGFASGLWGIATDPLKLRAASSTLADSIERTLQQLSALEGQANAHVQERLEQIRSIVNDALSGQKDLLDKATANMLLLEKTVYKDAIDLLYRAQCAAGHVNDELQNAVARVSEAISKIDPRVKVLGIPILELKTNPIVLQQPDEVYRATKAAYFSSLKDTSLKGSVSENSPAWIIFWTYQNLASQAYWTKCKYLDRAGGEAFTQEANELELLSRPWIEAINMQHFVSMEQFGK
jgi:hypothetical protein